MSSLLNVCESPSFLRVLLILKHAFKIVCVVVPLIIIITVIKSLIKPITSGNDDEIKEVFKVSVRKIIAGLVIFFIPSLVSYFISLTGEDTLYDAKQCMARVSLEDIEYYTKIESITALVDVAKRNPSKDSIEEARNAVDSAKGYLREDNMIKYLTDLDEAEQEIDKLKKQAECERKGSKYQNGYCYTVYKKFPEKKPTPGSGSSGDYNYNPAGGGGGTTTLNILNGSWTVVNTAMPVDRYALSLRSRGVYQGANPDRYNDKCLGFAYTHAWGLYNNNASYRGDDGMNYAGAGNFTTYINDDLQDVLGVVYNEINAGHPVILQVNGNKQGTSRHFVTVVGYDSSVRNASTLQATDLLILDSYDAQLERMDQGNSRFVVTGAACHKDYSGYRIQYLKQ